MFRLRKLASSKNQHLIKTLLKKELCTFRTSWGKSICFLLFLQYGYKVFTQPEHHYCPVGWGCRIHRLLLCRGISLLHPTNECPRYDTKQSDGEVPVMLVLWGMQSTPFIVIAPKSTLAWSSNTWSMGQIELNCIIMINWIAWNRTVGTC